jgi:hypothetical protein
VASMKPLQNKHCAHVFVDKCYKTPARSPTGRLKRS